MGKACGYSEHEVPWPSFTTCFLFSMSAEPGSWRLSVTPACSLADITCFPPTCVSLAPVPCFFPSSHPRSVTHTV